MSTKSSSLLALAPKDKDHNLPLLEIKEGVYRIEDVILSDDNALILNEILRAHQHMDVLSRYGLCPANRLLFCGQQGCGKTLTAEVLASELGFPLATVRLDSLISSYMGETAANLREVFRFVATTPMVVLFDEFDALAKERTSQDENNRLVNTFLQILDNYKGKSIIVAATNFEHILDAAIWSRFDEVLAFDSPDLDELQRLLSIKLRGLRREFEIEDANITKLFKNMTHSDVVRSIKRAAQNMALDNDEFLSERHLKFATQREKTRMDRIYG